MCTALYTDSKVAGASSSVIEASDDSVVGVSLVNNKGVITTTIKWPVFLLLRREREAKQDK